MIIIPDKLRRPAEVEREELRKQLSEARAEIEMLKHQLEDESMRADGMTTAHAEACAKNYRQQELIEQMREALEVALDCVKEIHGEESRDYTEIKAALAAERGE